MTVNELREQLRAAIAAERLEKLEREVSSLRRRLQRAEEKLIKANWSGSGPAAGEEKLKFYGA